MRPNFFHSSSSSSSSVSWQQQQQRNKEILAQFPYNMESSSSTHLNSSEGDEIDDHVVLGGRGLDLSEGVQKGGGLIISTTPLEKEHMFDKVVTPSDVGKLNRLVIPKQHAEKYFPLDSSTNEKGLLLNFEDRIGKPWRFRYSYWNSSQSYVMTKGWSRFVKDKKLDAGDIVSFSRGVGQLEKDRFFIDWRRRPTAPPLPLPPPPPHPSSSFLPGHQYFSNFHHPCFLQLQRCRDHPTNLHQINAVDPHHSTGYGLMNNGNPFPGSLIYFRSPIQATISPASGVGGIGMMQVQTRTSGAITDEDDPMVFESVPVVQGKAAAKRLRLFGVNMDCPISEVSDLSGPDIIIPSTAVSNSNPPPPPTGNFYSSSSSSSMWTPLPRKMFSDNKGKGSLSLDFDI